MLVQWFRSATEKPFSKSRALHFVQWIWTIYKCELAQRLSIWKPIGSVTCYVHDLLCAVYGLTFDCVSIDAWMKNDRFLNLSYGTLSMRWKRTEMKRNTRKRNWKIERGIVAHLAHLNNNFHIDSQLKHINIGRPAVWEGSLRYTFITWRPVVFLLCFIYE